MMTHNIIAPGWVYNLSDYQQMFDLNTKDFSKPLLDYPGSIASFNAEMHAMRHKVISGDPTYNLSFNEMKALSEEIYQKNLTYLQQHKEHLKQHDEAAIQQIARLWQENKNHFLNDYEQGQQEGRYVPMALPKLPFEDHTFRLALTSDFLFHTQVLKDEDPIALITELCRVAVEVRIFPLQDESGHNSDALGPIMMALQQQNLGLEVREVPFEQRKGANAMLRVWGKECLVE